MVFDNPGRGDVDLKQITMGVSAVEVLLEIGSARWLNGNFELE